MIKKLLLLIIFCSSISALAQNYPEAILPGEKKTFDAGQDTLWVLKERQLKQAIIKAEKLKIEEEITKELKKKVSLLEDKSSVQDSLVTDLKKDRDFYMNNWNDCKDDVKILIKKNKRQLLFTRLSLAGIAVAFLAGFLIAK